MDVKISLSSDFSPVLVYKSAKQRKLLVGMYFDRVFSLFLLNLKEVLDSNTNQPKLSSEPQIDLPNNEWIFK